MPVLLITDAEVISIALPDYENPVTTIADAYIHSAQLNWLRPALGRALYDHLTNAVAAATLTPEEQELMDEYLKPCLAWWVKCEAMPHIAYESRNPIDLQEQPLQAFEAVAGMLQHLREDCLRRAELLKDEMVSYIEEHLADFPLYEPQQEKESRKGGLLFW